jgi:hypothetical protein
MEEHDAMGYLVCLLGTINYELIVWGGETPPSPLLSSPSPRFCQGLISFFLSGAFAEDKKGEEAHLFKFS